MGDPHRDDTTATTHCDEVRQRGMAEGIGSVIAAKIANTPHNCRDLIATAGVEFR